MTDSPPSTPTAPEPERHDLSPEEKEAVERIMSELGEKLPNVHHQIRQIMEFRGLEWTQALLEETLKIEADGGMMTANEKRRRTPGGVFLYIARQRMTQPERKRIFNNREAKRRSKKKNKKKKKPSSPGIQIDPNLPLFNWTERIEVIAPLAQGVAPTMKSSLVGRPGDIATFQDVVVLTMENNPHKYTVPKGVPQPPDVSVPYTVYIAHKQWAKVAEAIKNPEDRLIIEGFCGWDQEMKRMAMYAQNVTTVMLQAAQRASKQAKAANADATAPKPAAAPAPKPAAQAQKPAEKKKAAPPPPPPAASLIPPLELPANVPPEIAQKARELHIAVYQYRERLAGLEAKPANQRLGYDMIRKLLTNTEKQLEDLLKPYQG